jgi:mono/diheme cytochrome c family protein
MIHEKKTVMVALGLLTIACASMAALGSVANAETLAQIRVPSGSNLFREHCAQCHGTDGTGNGPMAKILTVHPADLTSISKRDGGTFPAEHIAEVIRYGGNIQGHGDQQMPIWGKVFSSEGGSGKGGGAYSRRAVIELKNYIEKIQQK